MTHPYLTHLVEQIDKAFPGSSKITRRFADRPEAEQMAVEIEAESVAERAKDAEQYRTVDERCDAASRQALKALKVAQDHLVKIERDRLAAIDGVAKTSAAAASFNFQRDHERGRLEQKLRDSAHPQIAKTIDALQEMLTNNLRHGVALSFGEYRSPQTGERRHGVTGSNAAECQVAIDATHAAMAECAALQLSALRVTEVESRLAACLEGLHKPYADIGLGVPYAAGDEIVVPRAARPAAEVQA